MLKRLEVSKLKRIAILFLLLLSSFGLGFFVADSSEKEDRKLAVAMERWHLALEEDDYTTAYEVMIEYAEQGYAEAQFRMARFYYILGGEPFSIETYDKFRAKKWNCFSRSEKLGEEYSSREEYVEDYLFFFRECRKKAVGWLRLAAPQNHALSQYFLGGAYFSGAGIAKDLKKAADWYEKAGMNGSKDGLRSLARIYRHGFGRPRNFAKARELYEQLRHEGDMFAPLGLGEIYELGLGVDQDLDRAKSLYAEALARKAYRGALRLAHLYANKNYEIYDLEQAAKWWFVVDRKRPDLTMDHMQLQRQLSNEQRERGKQAAREWIKDNSK